MTYASSPSLRIASAAGEALRALSAPRGRQPVRVVTETKDAEQVSVVVPAEAFDALLAVLAEMARGNAVTVVPVEAELTTQQAADLLKVSRPHVVKLIEEGRLPHRLVGTHRRVLAADVLTFKKLDDEQRRLAADELAREAEKLGLGY